MKTIIKFKYIADTDQWHIKHLGQDGNWHTVQEWQDCENIPKFFPKADKEKEKLYTIEIEEYVTQRDRNGRRPNPEISAKDVLPGVQYERQNM